MNIQEYLKNINIDNKLSDKEEQLILLIKENGMENEMYSFIQKIKNRENEIKITKERKKHIESMIKIKKRSLDNYFKEQGISPTSKWAQKIIKKEMEEYADKLQRDMKI